jgi:hypothetical protein
MEYIFNMLHEPINWIRDRCNMNLLAVLFVMSLILITHLDIQSRNATEVINPSTVSQIYSSIV